MICGRSTILLHCGGRIVSLRSVRTGVEFLLPPLQNHTPVSSSSFALRNNGRSDGCLPSIAACPARNGEAAVPDHGDVWRADWHIESASPDMVLHADARSRPLRLHRSMQLKHATLHFDYTLRNLS